jgi:peptidoglycan/xylan/chitin deacetylase (PgdA/CDA1 family)
MKRGAKALFGRLMFATRLDAILLRGAAVIVAFHRVHDGEDASGLTVSPAMFERHCRFFKRHFHVVPLTELVERLGAGRPVARHLAITFDDGYRDNFENARPILEALSLPATFFIVSQWMGTDTWPWWDRERGVRYPWMSWDQVRELSRRGFEIGAHTRTHPDLGRLDGAAAWDEMAGARAEIEGQLGKAVDLFAYPYGGRANIADSNRRLVKAAGFRCCCSCYGGLTDRGADPFHLQRIAVSQWYGSPHQFGAELVREVAVQAKPEGRGCCEISEAIGY